MKAVTVYFTSSASLRNQEGLKKIHIRGLIATISLIATMILLLWLINIKTSASNTTPKYKAPLAKLSERVSIQAAGRGNPRISLADGRDVITFFSGPRHLVNALENNQVEPRSLASADFDEDGVPDLISSYSSSHGGIVSLMRGNVDSIYQNADEAKQRKDEGTFTDSPFLGPAFVFAVPVSADFLGAGDFNGDGHRDVVAAGQGGRKLYLLSLDAVSQAEVKPTAISRLSLPFNIHSIEVGNFTGDHDSEIAILSDEGIHMLSEPIAGSKELKNEVIARGSWGKTGKLVCVRVFGEPADNLAVVDSSMHQLQILSGNIKAGERPGAELKPSPRGISALLDIETEPMAILPVQLNADALSDLVILRAGQALPSVTITQAQSTFTVVNTNDDGTGSLRDAINQANENQGLDQIVFNGPTPNLFGGTGTVIQNNFIGTDLSGTAPVPNAENGIFVETESVIYTIKDNLIAFNGENGIFIPNISSRPGTPGFRVQILSNFIFSNEGLPIELGNIGINPNDDKDPDAGANELQNSPVLNSATLSIPSLSTAGVLRPAAIAISRTFNSTPNTNFTLEFYFGLSCCGEGSQLIGFVPIRINTLQVTTDGNGNVPYMFSLELPGGQRGGYVNCTATNPTGNTSEFSECITVGAPSPIITTAVIKGKNLSVHGGNFERGANIVLNGQLQKTKFNSISLLTGKKLGKKIKPGDKLKIRNPNGTESEEFTFAGS